MLEPVILIVIGWALGLITALINQRYSHNLEMKRLLTEMRIQREQELLKSAGEWNQKEALARLGNIIVRDKYTQLASVLKSLPQATLEVDRGDNKTYTVQIRGRGAFIGSHSSCDIRITDEQLADYHAHIIIADETFVLEDVGASSPILLNGNALLFPSLLRDGDMIQVGKVKLKFKRT